ncbi:nicotinate-nucleotide pyrophosphorylase (carboxylating) [Desulfocapsa sulfexigens DSM 10523]|uniref:Probable nicotinate-nucleotide pyrophosphorylase [carboxylating] n=1 Tax=Desulfocapsa sulfexigens (strain DSM 10523 / SB164P1) TaxID=1167006 RepID=M1PAD5_DESSD|nr:carboxylating nicotinate-nucleotide diphosphorylase [Desulfocapsa sulfexigens]AGF76765.1 nicotinate-nucleotide pyrophosphorylase (carboxylating) [Desulfocapsa sulfexigens DSM 10523]
MDKDLLTSLLRSFLREDIGNGDLSSEPLFGKDEQGCARLVARESFVAAGVDSVAAQVFSLQNPEIQCTGAVNDGRVVSPGDILLMVSGPVVDLLKAERVALNLLQRLSGIATLTARFVEKTKLFPVRITDTRKTTPGLRMLEKYAVRVGGGYNHRFNLSDGVLIKDNHIAARGSLTQAVQILREKVPHTIKIEVETDTLDQVRECLECHADIIMLDNMDLETMKQAVAMIDGRALVEASGGVNLDTVAGIAATGVDIISVGALTHSAPSCDIGMDWQILP